MDKIGETLFTSTRRDGHYGKTEYLLAVLPKDDKPGALRPGQEGKRILSIRTSKHSNGVLATRASVCVEWPDGMMSFMMFGDFSKTVIQSRAKGTEKAIRQQHAEALKQIDAIEAEARAYYAEKESAQDINARRDRELAEQDARDAAQSTPLGA